MKLFLFTALLLLFPVVYGNNSKLIAQKIKELKELNELVLKTIKAPEQFNGKNIFVQVKILPNNGKNVRFKVEKISINKIKPANSTSNNTLYLKGKVEKSGSDNYKVDLSHVLPESDKPKKLSTQAVSIKHKQGTNKNEKTKVAN